MNAGRHGTNGTHAQNGSADTVQRALAVIPARGGSKQVPRKNLKLLGGKPLIQWSIEAARAATELDRCIVSTDDEEIAEMARALGAEVPFLRPAEFAQDNTPDLPVFQHAIRWLGEHEGYRPAMVVHLRPTLPFREPRQIHHRAALVREPRGDRRKAGHPRPPPPPKM